MDWIPCIANAMDVDTDEWLLDLLTCHRSDTWLILVEWYLLFQMVWLYIDLQLFPIFLPRKLKALSHGHHFWGLPLIIAQPMTCWRGMLRPFHCLNGWLLSHPLCSPTRASSPLQVRQLPWVNFWLSICRPQMLLLGRCCSTPFQWLNELLRNGIPWYSK